VLSSNFLIPPDENVYSGKTIAQLCCDSLKDFNPMVRVFVEKGSYLPFPLSSCFLYYTFFFVVFPFFWVLYLFFVYPYLLFVLSSGDLSSFDVEFFGKFDVVVVSCCSRSAKVQWKLLLPCSLLWLSDIISFLLIFYYFAVETSQWKMPESIKTCSILYCWL